MRPGEVDMVIRPLTSRPMVRIAAVVLFILGGVLVVMNVRALLLVSVASLLIVGIFAVPELGLIAFLFASQVKNLIPMIGDPTSVVPTAILLSITAASIIWNLMRRRTELTHRFGLNTKFILLIVFCFYLLLSAWLVGDSAWSLEKTIRFGLFSIGFILGTAWMAKDRIRIKRLIALMIGGKLIVSVSGFLSPAFVGEGLASFSYNYIDFSRAVGIGLILTTTILVWKPNNRPATLVLLASVLVVCWLAMLSSNSRGSFVAAVVCTGIILLRRLLISNHKVATTVLILTTGAFVLIVLFTDTNLIAPENANRFLGLTDLSADLSYSSRTYIYDVAWRQFLESPIFGIGIGNFDIPIVNSKLHVNYAHNVFLELLSETGLVGFVLFLFPVLVTIQAGVSHFFSQTADREYDWIMMCIISGLVFYLVVAQISGDIQINRNLWLFVGLMWVGETLYGVQSNNPAITEGEL